MPKVITVAQQKGGAGKTSIAAHLAIAWAGLGTEQHGRSFRQDMDYRSGEAPKARKNILLLDLDPQESLSDWFRVREGRLGRDENLTVVSASHWRENPNLIREHQSADYIVIDTPPHTEVAAAREAIRMSDLVVVPAQLSPMDIWASESTLALIAEEDKPCVIVLNRVPPRARLADELMAQLKAEDLPLARTHVGNRIAFAASMLHGLGVTEAAPSSLAAAEIRLLAGEVLRKVA